jgi:RNA polymerase sigma-70 factor, ECF subfamily
MNTGSWSASPSASSQPLTVGTMLHPSVSDRDPEERPLVQGLRDGDEAAFVSLIRRHHPMLTRRARLYVADGAADDLAQDVWRSAFGQIDQLDAGMSVRVALLTILHEQARCRLPAEEARIPFAAHWDPANEPVAPSVNPARFRTGEPWPGHWAISVPEWETTRVEQLLTCPSSARIEDEIARLPQAQREVLTLRDVEGWTSGEVSAALGITEATQRLLLHGGRSRMRAALDAIILEG